MVETSKVPPWYFRKDIIDEDALPTEAVTTRELEVLPDIWQDYSGLFVSERLLALVDEMDPDAIERGFRWTLYNAPRRQRGRAPTLTVP